MTRCPCGRCERRSRVAGDQRDSAGCRTPFRRGALSDGSVVGPAAPGAADRRDRVDQGLEDTRVMHVGSRALDRQRYALPVDDEVVLRAELASIGWVPPGGVSPSFASTLMLSKQARSKSIAPSSPSQLKIARCRRAHTPAACQSRMPRQQVVPLPYPNSVGRRFQGIPVWSTKMIPPSAALPLQARLTARRRGGAPGPPAQHSSRGATRPPAVRLPTRLRPPHADFGNGPGREDL